MQVIRYKQAEDLITIEVTIMGTPSWYYYYKEDQFHDNDNVKNKKKEHTLGKPHELVVRAHTWQFRLGNPSNTQITADVEIFWYQIIGGVKTQIHYWSEKGVKLPAGGGEVSGESALIEAV